MFLSKYNKSKVFPLVVVAGFLFIGLVIYFRPGADPNSSVSIRPEEMTPTPVITGQAITMSGEMVCLPHRDQSGPQTMECAYGLKTPEGVYYALRDSDPTYKNISGLPTGTTVTITGIFHAQEDTKYPTEGVIEIQTVSK